ncbi:MAG TPA: nuclease-related domain-containing protein [Actinomycetota bacterium]|nr:nuclease-related domain-containing protein [Actinomycetota bacterium]
MAASSTSTFSALRLLSNLFPGLGRPPTSWEKGAAGEEAVARRLEKLPPHEWIALHDLPLGSGGRNVDHLVIGARGIFSLNTKNLSGNVVVKRNAFLVGGFGDRCLHVARDEASKVGERLTLAVGEPVHVNPVIVVLAPALVVDSQPDDVHVAGIDEIVRWLTSRPEVLGARMASRTYEAARRRRTWTEDVSALAPFLETR